MQLIGYVAGVPRKFEATEVAPGQYLAVDAAEAWAELVAAAARDGITLRINSGWRSHDHQTRLYQQWADGRRRHRPARPGYSAHQSGVAADIQRSHDDPDGGGPERGATDLWLEAHAHEYGWRRTVPGEPWHWEYVGELDDDFRG
jgi:LAS superfamily LD-carboxypeptidase LdcB